MAYPEGLLVPGERVLVHRRPHVRMLLGPVLVLPLLALAGGWLAAAASLLSWRATAWVLIGAVAVALAARFCLAPVLRWRSSHFVVTDRRLLVREGVLARSGVAVGADTIAAVHTRQTLPERLLRCGTLVVAVDGHDDAWEFDGLGDVAGTAIVLERVAVGTDGGHDDDGYDAPPPARHALEPRRRG